jgi:hypothetical protein
MGDRAIKRWALLHLIHIEMRTQYAVVKCSPRSSRAMFVIAHLKTQNKLRLPNARSTYHSAVPVRLVSIAMLSAKWTTYLTLS